MFPQTIKRREEEEYQKYCTSMKNKGLTPEPSLYKAYVKSETDAGRTPRPAVIWANDRAKIAYENETVDVKAQITKAVEDYSNRKIAKIEPTRKDGPDVSEVESEDEAGGEPLSSTAKERRKQQNL